MHECFSSVRITPGIVLSFLQQICSSASYYADLLFEKMIKNNYYDQDPSQFGVSEEVSTRKFIKRVLINFSVYGVSEFLSLSTRFTWSCIITRLSWSR